MTYEEMLHTLYGRSQRGMRLGLEPTRRLLAALGRPDLEATQVVVAGTNGKGSTSALLARALSRSGRKVGLFTSPHLVAFTERIRIDGRSIARERAVALFEEVVAAAHRAGVNPSFFECVTAMSALAFRAAGVDVGVWEVGLGGRLDATNAVSHQLSVITRVALDHQEVLGGTLTAIAREKAGIICPRQPVVVAPQAPSAARAIAEVARHQEACVIDAEPAAHLPLGLPAYQRDNVGCARAAAAILGVPAATFTAALSGFCWPGRYHFVDQTVPILLDGAHNPDGMRAFCRAMKNDARLARRQLLVIFSALARHGHEALVAPLRALKAPIFVCPNSSQKSLSSSGLMRLLPEGRLCKSPAAALARARREARGKAAVVVVVGSLYLVGDILRVLGDRPAEVALDG